MSSFFVGNVSYQAREEDLRQLFQQVGDVQQIFLPSVEGTGQHGPPRHRGYAFVQFRDGAMNSSETW